MLNIETNYCFQWPVNLTQTAAVFTWCVPNNGPIDET